MAQLKAVPSVLVAVLLFVGTQYLVTYRELTYMDGQKMDLQDALLDRDRMLSDLRMNLQDKERQLYRTTVRVKELERRCSQRMKVTNRSAAQTAAGEDNRIVFVTPTYWRPTQKAELTRLGHTLQHVPGLLWLVVEDADATSTSVKEVLERSGVPFVHLCASTPARYKLNDTQPSWLLPKGVAQRNRALEWLRTQSARAMSGVVYFGDDDNTYDLRLFGELRRVAARPDQVGVLPVGLAGGLLVERPLIDLQTGAVSGWMTGWKPERPFPIDMAGFGIGSHLLLQEHPRATFSYDVPRGYQESHLLEQLGVTLQALLPLADNCTRVLVWHTRTEAAKLKQEVFLEQQGTSSHVGMLEI